MYHQYCYFRRSSKLVSSPDRTSWFSALVAVLLLQAPKLWADPRYDLSENMVIRWLIDSYSTKAITTNQMKCVGPYCIVDPSSCYIIWVNTVSSACCLSRVFTQFAHLFVTNANIFEVTHNTLPVVTFNLFHGRARPRQVSQLQEVAYHNALDALKKRVILRHDSDGIVKTYIH